MVNSASPFTSCGPYHGTPPGEESVSSGVVSKVEGLRDKILEDYKETAFRKELWPDPPCVEPMEWLPYHSRRARFPSRPKRSVCMGSELRLTSEWCRIGWIGDSLNDPTLPIHRSG